MRRRSSGERLIVIYQGDGGQMPGNRCSNCIAFHFQCTYVEAAKVRPPFYPVSILAPAFDVTPF